jgi:hypothetical protein
MELIRNRLREPSTWAGFGVLYMLVEGVLMGTSNWAAQAPALLMAVVAIVKGEVAKL